LTEQCECVKPFKNYPDCDQYDCGLGGTGIDDVFLGNDLTAWRCMCSAGYRVNYSNPHQCIRDCDVYGTERSFAELCVCKETYFGDTCSETSGPALTFVPDTAPISPSTYSVSTLGIVAVAISSCVVVSALMLYVSGFFAFSGHE
jgi:hypothetical protein